MGFVSIVRYLNLAKVRRQVVSDHLVHKYVAQSPMVAAFCVPIICAHLSCLMSGCHPGSHGRIG